MTKKNASLEALFSESESPAIAEEKPSVKSINQSMHDKNKKSRGRPKKIEGKRQQYPLYLPEAVYFECLDWVGLQKRSDRQYSMNDLMLEALDVWLTKKGRPSIKELIEKNK